MSLIQNCKNNNSEPIHSLKKIKIPIISLQKDKKVLKPSKTRKQFQCIKKEIRQCNKPQSLDLENIMSCGGIKLNSRLNRTQDKKKRSGLVKTATISSKHKNNQAALSFQKLRSPPSLSLTENQIILSNPEQSQLFSEFSLIDRKDILIRKQNRFLKKGNLFGFNLRQKCFVSLYKCENSNPYIVTHNNILYSEEYCIFQQNGEKYYITDMYQDYSIRNLMMEFGLLPQITAKLYLRQLIQGVNQLHRLNLAHNRINLDNVLHDKMGKVLINYFKSSTKPLQQFQKSRYFYYFPPQMLLSSNYYNSFKNDVWAIGCITLQLFSSKSIKLSKYHPYNKDLTGKDQTQEIITLQQIQKLISEKYEIGSINIDADAGNEIQTSVIEFISLCFSIKVENRSSLDELLMHPFLWK